MMKIKKNRNLHGSVLLTVVVVMSLLIVFLFGTLALATAANNRAHVNYSSSQTNVTSRMVVDAAIKAMKADTNYGNVISKIGTDAGASSLNVSVQLGSTVPNVGRYGDISPVTIEPVGTKKFYDTATKQWVDGDILKFSANVSMAGVNSRTSAYIVKQPPSEGGNGDGGGAGFVTTASANIACQTNLFGGSYINLPRLGVNVGNNKDAEGRNIYDDGTDTKGAIFYDYTYRATDAEYENWENDASIYRQFGKKNDGTSTPAFQLTNFNDDQYYSIESDLYVNNNFEVYQAPHFIFPSAGKGITVWGDWVFSQNSAGKNIAFSVPFSTAGLQFNEVPYIFVDGAIKAPAQSLGIGHVDKVTGQNKFPLNIFCGHIEAKDANYFELGGDLYCMDPYRENNLELDKTTTLYQWSGSVVNQAAASSAFTIGGKISAKGTTRLKNIKTSGDVRVEKDCYIENNVKIGGNLIVGHNLYIKGDSSKSDEDIIKSIFSNHDGKIYCDNIYINGVEYKTEQEAIDFKVPNYEMNYVHYIVKNTNLEGKSTGLFGEVINDVNVGDIVAYRWKQTPGDWEKLQMYFWANSPEDWQINNAKNWLNQEADWPKEIHALESETGSATNYYIKTLVSTSSVKLKDIDKNNDNVLKLEPWQKLSDRYSVFEDISQPTTERYTVQTLPATTISNDRVKKITDFNSSAEYHGDAVYPKYAEKEVILGLETLTGVDAKETKIVKRLEEVLDSNSPYYVSNPYKYESLPEGIGGIYTNNLIPNVSKTGSQKIYFTSHTDILDTVGQCVKNVTGYEERATDGSGNMIVTKEPYELADKSQYGEGIYIDRSCILDLNYNDGNAKRIVINPEDKDILIVIRGQLTVSSGYNIIVDDRMGGTVNFYIENGGSFNLAGGYLTTVRYETALRENKGGALKYKSADDKPGYDLSNLGKPKVNIYGAANTKMDVGNAQYIVANILSPNIKFTMAAGSTDLTFSNIYYNNTDIKNPTYGKQSQMSQFLIGCLNSETASIPNCLNVIFITDDGDDDGDNIGDGDSAFSYRILYYDEY